MLCSPDPDPAPLNGCSYVICGPLEGICGDSCYTGQKECCGGVAYDPIAGNECCGSEYIAGRQTADDICCGGEFHTKQENYQCCGDRYDTYYGPCGSFFKCLTNKICSSQIWCECK